MKESENYILDDQGAILIKVGEEVLRLTNEAGKDIRIERVKHYTNKDENVNLKIGDSIDINSKLIMKLTEEGMIEFRINENDDKSKVSSNQNAQGIIFSTDWIPEIEGMYSSDIPFIAEAIREANLFKKGEPKRFIDMYMIEYKLARVSQNTAEYDKLLYLKGLLQSGKSLEDVQASYYRLCGKYSESGIAIDK